MPHQNNNKIKPKASVSMVGPKIVVGLTCIITAGAVVYSHYSQVRDKEIMRAGVQRDKERMRMKKLMKNQQQ